MTISSCNNVYELIILKFRIKEKKETYAWIIKLKQTEVGNKEWVEYILPRIKICMLIHV